MNNPLADHQTPAQRAGLGACLVGLAVASLAGCTTPPVTTESAWGEGVPRNQTYSRLLVLGISPESNQRCAFERYLVETLRSAAVVAKTSCSVMDPKEPLTRESVERAVGAVGADAVLATHLVESSQQLTEGGSMDTRGGARYKAIGTGFSTGYWGVYGVPVVYGEFQTSPSVFAVQGTARISTQLYQTRDAGLVYSIETKAANFESRDQVLFDVTLAITERLRRDGLIR